MNSDTLPIINSLKMSIEKLLLVNIKRLRNDIFI